MEVLHYIRRRESKREYIDETWLNHSQHQEALPYVWRIYAFGRERIMKKQSFSPSCLAMNKLLLIFCNGPCKMLLRDQNWQTLSPGHAVFVCPMDEIKQTIANETDHSIVRYYLILERNVDLERIFRLEGTEVMHVQSPERMFMLLENLHHMVRTPGKYTSLDFSCRLFELLSHLSQGRRFVSYQFQSTYGQLLDLVASYPENYSTRKSLLALFKVSIDKLNHIFREQTGMAPMSFVIHMRMMNSCWQLRHTEMNMAEIAVANGYGNAAYYSNAFKKAYGMSPLAYRKRWSREHRCEILME